MYDTTDFIIEEGRLIRCCRTRAKDVKIPDGVTEIGRWAFRRLRELRTVILPEGVTIIHERAFEDCTELEQVNFPDGLTHIGEMAFLNCDRLTRVHLPDSLIHLGTFAFLNCRALKELQLPAHITDSDTAFVNCRALADKNDMIIVNHVLHDYIGEARSVTIPDGVVQIGNSAFCDQNMLGQICIPDTVQRIGIGTFSGCDRLANADGYVIVRDTLYECFSEKPHIIIPDGITRLGDGALCQALSISDYRRRITIPEQVTRIGHGVFGYMEKNTTVQIEVEGCPEVYPDSFYGVRYLIAPRLPWSFFKDAELRQAAIRGFLADPARYEQNADYAQYCRYAMRQRRKLMPEILERDEVTAIAFWLAHGKVTLAVFEQEYLNPALAANAFQCTAFLLEWKEKHFTAEDMERQLQRALNCNPYNKEDMKALWSWEKQVDGTLQITGYKGDSKHIIVPARIGRKAVTAIGPEIFAGSETLRSIQVEPGITSIGDRAFAGCGSLTEAALPDSVTEIGDAAFRDCAKLTEVNLPDGMTELPKAMFANCRNLTEVKLPARLTRIGSYAFLYCDRLTHLELPSSVTEIDGHAFYACASLARLTFPAAFPMIGQGAFKGCTMLQDDRGFVILQNRLFAYCGTETDVTVPDGVTEIMPDAFQGHETVTSVTIPGSVKRIGRDTFIGCNALTQVTLADGVEEIHWCAFYSMNNLRRIRMPSSLTAIHPFAFLDCKQLTICAPAGSYAQDYAQKEHIPFEEERADG